MTKKWLYDEAMYRFASPEPSYWEATASSDRPDAPALQENDACDVAVIGGGYTGLSAAYHLAGDQAEMVVSAAWAEKRSAPRPWSAGMVRMPPRTITGARWRRSISSVT